MLKANRDLSFIVISYYSLLLLLFTGFSPRQRLFWKYPDQYEKLVVIYLGKILMFKIVNYIFKPAFSSRKKKLQYVYFEHFFCFIILS